MVKYFKEMNSTLVISIALVIGLVFSAVVIRSGILGFRSYERTVQVKGLSEREYPADIIMAPVPVTATGNDSAVLYSQLDRQAQRVRSFLLDEGVAESDVTVSIPNVIDKAAREYSGSDIGDTRYTGTVVVTIYSTNVNKVRETFNKIGSLGREGIVMRLGDYEYQTEYHFSKLNDVKSEMLKEAALNARQSAQTFANDSGSKVGKLKTASQGQFSINPRDNNTPHIKIVRVVVTMDYYLND
ncbi:MAG: SIMPL domain-containing protein [Brevinema sp.]